MKRFRPAVVVPILVLVCGWVAFLPMFSNFRESERQAVGTSLRVKESKEKVVDEGLDSIHIPFTLTKSNNISVPVLLNGTDRLELMFHTAVDSIYLTSEAVKKLHNFETTESTELKSWGGKAVIDVSVGNRLQIGELHWTDQSIFVDELSGHGTDGKFGPNLFKEILEINFDTRELVLHKSLPSHLRTPESIYQKCDYTVEHGSMTIVGELSIGDVRYANAFMIHSGFSGTALLDDAFVSQHDLNSKLVTISERELKDSLGNVIKTKKVMLPALDFGALHFSDVPIEIFDGSLGQQKVSVLGGDLLKRCNMIFDPQNRHVYLTPSILVSDAFTH